MKDSEIFEYIDQMRPRDRGVLVNKAMGIVGLFTVLVAGIPSFLSIPIGSSIGRYLGLESTGCIACVVVYFAATIFLWALFVTRYLRWKLLTQMKKRLRVGIFQPCPVCNSIEADEAQMKCECGCQLRQTPA